MRIIERFKAAEPVRHRPAAMPPPAGSTPHEPGNPQSPPLCRSVLRVHGRPQRRSSKPASRKAPIGLESLSSGNSGLIAITAWRRNHSVRRVIRSGSLDDAVEIPIEPAAPLPLHPAASVPAGFRTTAPVRVAGLVVGPSSETLYRRGRPHSLNLRSAVAEVSRRWLGWLRERSPWYRARIRVIQQVSGVKIGVKLGSALPSEIEQRPYARG